MLGLRMLKYIFMNMRMVFMFLFAGTILFSASSAKAQRLVFVYANGMYNKPTGKFSDVNYNYGLGGEIGAGVGLATKTFITGSVGYNTFNNTTSGVSNLKATPIKFGFRQYLVARILFAKLDAGIAQTKADGFDGSKSKFTMGIGTGVKLAGLNLGIDYNTINLSEGGTNWIGWLAFKAGFSIGL